MVTLRTGALATTSTESATLSMGVGGSATGAAAAADFCAARAGDLDTTSLLRVERARATRLGFATVASARLFALARVFAFAGLRALVRLFALARVFVFAGLRALVRLFALARVFVFARLFVFARVFVFAGFTFARVFACAGLLGFARRVALARVFAFARVFALAGLLGFARLFVFARVFAFAGVFAFARVFALTFAGAFALAGFFPAERALVDLTEEAFSLRFCAALAAFPPARELRLVDLTGVFLLAPIGSGSRPVASLIEEVNRKSLCIRQGEHALSLNARVCPFPLGPKTVTLGGPCCDEPSCVVCSLRGS